MKMKFAVALAATALASQAFAQTKWDLPSAYPASNFHTENLAQFVSDVDKGSGGKLKITLHPNASLFKAPEIKRAVQGNQAQAGEFLMANFQNEWPLWGIDGVPFLATSFADAKRLYDASKPAIEKKLNEQGMTLLYAVPWPPQGLYSRNPVKSQADLKGIKWRAYSPATARIAELVGAQPVTIQQAELSQAMATGVLDSYMSSGSTGYDTKTYEHLKYFYDLQAWLPKNAVVANKKALEALDKPTQDALRKAAAEAETRGWASSEKKTGEYLDLLKKNGMTVEPPSAQLKTDMQKVGEVMLKEWLDKAGPEGKAVVDAYRK
ncbi:TRAP transporter substrate-binding protein [Ottowia sp.]|uniref:TRAP transporter substrate-binding protein n=1 Tax=Ottowia sp. TaxID=1898956 RepID=UPI002B52D792|nr:TRAP transporter substrate-binding protein [Ottowia sp.]MCP5258635.1 TRAP transporter substrate-binding protein [Burkholderiaceae bacterium]HPK34157.1 TRAP transporter substrate-binding protein [Ottowia sp.]HRW71514.1 TRAP transporter substrate-binding protein [Ottowia sp.]